MKKILALIVLTSNLVAFSQMNDSLKSILLKELGVLDSNIHTPAFLEGANEALGYPILAIRSVGDPSHVSSCKYYSYSKYGVKLQMTGDIILDHDIYERNRGFNYIMYRWFSDSIPQWKDSLGIVQDGWVMFNKELRLDFISLFKMSKATDSTINFQLDTMRLEYSIFRNLKGITLTDAILKYSYNYKELIEGVQLSVFNSNHSNVFLEVDFSQCFGLENICTSFRTYKFNTKLE